MNRNSNVYYIVESGIMIALATVLSMVKIYHSPFGGSVTAGSMVPIMIIALRWGVGRGILAGAVYGIIQSIIDPYIVHPVQFVLDYPMAFGLLGLAGLGRQYMQKISAGSSKIKEYALLSLGVVFAIFGRFASHVLAGVVFFKEFAGDQNVWAYSAIYNGTYLSPELIISIFVIIALWNPIKRLHFWKR
ncbi:energy-coupled thiamine transporter ThiT [Sporosalibacterium faouarense]|uniref:energy-coupled thiamine transporter ThiT n=1 Tax=Sporosalibacterium faouarense TaxID=516123 RepID=UPI00192CBDD6|nr:energy-coupled thiamine transporter ThiT [Sporosalibacterium faouarense]